MPTQAELERRIARAILRRGREHDIVTTPLSVSFTRTAPREEVELAVEAARPGCTVDWSTLTLVDVERDRCNCLLRRDGV